MNKTIAILSLAIASMGFSAGLLASDYDVPDPYAGVEHGFTISPMVGFHDFDSSRQLDDEGAVWLALGWRLNNKWSIEGSYYTADTENDETRADVDYDLLRLDGLYHLDSDFPVKPYWVFGAGETRFSATNESIHEIFINYGVGFMYAINDSTSWRVDLRALSDIGDKFDTDFSLSTGLHFSFGSGKVFHIEPPVPVSVDDDNDGVNNDVDACPDTAQGVTVDEAGCALDSDGDGVVNDQDTCPDTPEGVAVDATGCALDDDGDGVPNYRDDCPDTEPGAKVNEQGCYIILQESREINLNVKFPNNSSVIPSAYLQEIKAVADFMAEYPQTEVAIEGYTDDRGDAKYNQFLSQRRADSVAKTLTDKYSVAPSRVSSKGYGEENPIASNDTAEGRSDNRRVVAVIKATVEKRAE